jgi:hypothetical protein
MTSEPLSDISGKQKSRRRTQLCLLSLSSFPALLRFTIHNSVGPLVHRMSTEYPPNLQFEAVVRHPDLLRFLHQHSANVRYLGVSAADRSLSFFCSTKPYCCTMNLLLLLSVSGAFDYPQLLASPIGDEYYTGACAPVMY